MSTYHKRSRRILLTPTGGVNNDTRQSDVTFKIPYLKKEEKSVSSISFMSAVFPASYYNVGDYYNTIKMTINGVGLSYNFSAANYTYASFITMLLAWLPTGFAIIYDVSNGKFTFTYSQSFSILSSSTCFRVLGLTENISLTATLISSVYSLTCTNPANFLGPTKFIISTPSLCLENWNSQNSTTFLADVNITAAPDNVTVYEDQLQTEMFLEDHSLKSELRILIRDEYGLAVNFRNIPWFITIIIHTYLPEFPWPQNIHSFLDDVRDTQTKKRARPEDDNEQPQNQSSNEEPPQEPQEPQELDAAGEQ
jgi:hypothetical protein